MLYDCFTFKFLCVQEDTQLLKQSLIVRIFIEGIVKVNVIQHICWFNAHSRFNTSYERHEI
jgi:hypothetical protein